MTNFSARIYVLGAAALVAGTFASVALVFGVYSNQNTQDGIKRAWHSVLCDPAVPHSQSLAQRNFILVHDIHTAPCAPPEARR